MTKMKWRILIRILIVLFVVIFLYFAALGWFYSLAFVPTNSTRHKLTIAPHNGKVPKNAVVTLKHYANDVHVRDYILVIEGIYTQETQTYELPNINHGTIEVIVELEGNGFSKKDSKFTLGYEQAEVLYRRGLLIYFTNNGNKRSLTINKNELEDSHKTAFDRYVYFASGKMKICYYRTVYFQQRRDYEQVGFSEWLLVTKPPQMSMVSLVDLPYIYPYSGWKEKNKWMIKDDID